LTAVSGMIWHMDPFLMPTSFCWAQITLMNYSSFVLTGVCACFTYATTVAVIFPAQADTSPYSWVQQSFDDYVLVLMPSDGSAHYNSVTAIISHLVRDFLNELL
jgi:hypothetical protein